METSLSAHAKPWAPGSRPPPQQLQQPMMSRMGGGGGGWTANDGSSGGGGGVQSHDAYSRYHNPYAASSGQQGMGMNAQQGRGMGGMGAGTHPGSATTRRTMSAVSSTQDMYSGHQRGSPHTMQGHALSQQQQQAPQQKLSPTAAKLFVGQLPFECTEERLRNLFSAYGSVEHIHILRDSSNRSRGAAFVTYSTVQEADTAIFTLHNRYRMLTNRAIQVSYAKNSLNISPFGTFSALAVHQSNPTNPVPDVATVVQNFYS